MSIKKLFDEITNSSLFRTNGNLDYFEIIEKITELANLVNDADKVNWGLGEGSEATLDSLMAGAYWYAADYHSGQWSIEYAMSSAIGQFYSPGMESLDDDSPEKIVYELLELVLTTI